MTEPRTAARALGFAVEAMRGQVLGQGDDGAGDSRFAGALFTGAAVDSRAVRPGDLFFALPGEKVDGYDFCAAAVTAGAAAVVVDRRRGTPAGLAGRNAGREETRTADGGPPRVVPVIGVDEPLAALADLARAIRAQFRGHVVGITGSNGKTTTKELTAAALGATGTVLRTQGNFNTEIGLPLTIIGATGAESFWVLEMAMRGRGQIALLADIAKPHVGVITNVAGAHMELLGSLEEVAHAKGELFGALGEEGVAILPGGDRLIEAEAAHLPESRKLRFDAAFGARFDAQLDAGQAFPPAPASASSGHPVDVVILDTQPAGVSGQIVRFAVRDQPVVARLPLGGLHNARNAAAALAVTAALDLPIPAAAAALAHTVLPPHRSAPTVVAGRIILDDCYNANPSSMRAALASVFASASGSRASAHAGAGGGGGSGGRTFAILGDMLELGPDASEVHQAIGREAGARLTGLATVGPLGAQIAAGARQAGLPAARALAADGPAAAAAAVASWSRPGDWILVKASRGMRLERAIEALVEEFRKQPALT